MRVGTSLSYQWKYNIKIRTEVTTWIWIRIGFIIWIGYFFIWHCELRCLLFANWRCINKLNVGKQKLFWLNTHVLWSLCVVSWAVAVWNNVHQITKEKKKEAESTSVLQDSFYSATQPSPGVRHLQKRKRKKRNSSLTVSNFSSPVGLDTDCLFVEEWGGQGPRQGHRWLHLEYVRLKQQCVKGQRSPETRSSMEQTEGKLKQPQSWEKIWSTPSELQIVFRWGILSLLYIILKCHFWFKWFLL